MNCFTKHGGALEIRKLPSCESIASYKNVYAAAFTRNNDFVLLLEYKSDKHEISAREIRKDRRVWSSSIDQQKESFDQIVGQDKVVCIQDVKGNARIVDIATGHTLFDFQDVIKRPEFANLNKLDLNSMGVTFSHTSMRFLTYWHVKNDERKSKDKLQVVVWKLVRPIE